MRKSFIILVLVALTCLCQHSNAQSTMVFKNTVHDFGDIQEKDGVVSCVFTFVNEGKSPFVIENVSVSCGCTTPEYLKKPVMPGESRTITISFDPEGRSGEFLKDVFITSNNRQNRNTLQIKGNITARPRTLKDEYPVELTSGIRLSLLNVNFRYIPVGAVTSTIVKVVNTSDKTVTLETISTSSSVSSPKALVLEAGEKGDLTVSYDLKAGEWGMHSAGLKLKVNELLQNYELAVTSIGVDDFSLMSQMEFENPAKAVFSSQFCNFGNVKNGENLKRDILLTNQGEHNLVVREVTLPEGVKATLKAGDVVAPGGKLTVSIEAQTSLQDVGRLNKSIVVILNDPIRPMRELRLTAIVE